MKKPGRPTSQRQYFEVCRLRDEQKNEPLEQKDRLHVDCQRLSHGCLACIDKLPISSKRDVSQEQSRSCLYSKDQFYWMGDHQEDRLNEVRARSGYSDKLSVAVGKNENGSVRAVIHGELGRKGALLLLSSYLRMACSKRNQSFMMETGHTFKPPPRVTLVDNRRENWLDDLANQRVPLRRLSRTIPHGVRGVSLIEQCTSRQISYYRSIWLCRCVNSNELRGLKRKTGASSGPIYGKWVEEWTLQVLEAVVKGLLAGTRHVRVQLRYLVGLFCQMLNEQLLDGGMHLAHGIKQRGVNKIPWYGVVILWRLAGSSSAFEQLVSSLMKLGSSRLILQNLQPTPFAIRHSTLRHNYVMGCVEKDEVALLRFYNDKTLSSVCRTDVLRTVTQNAFNWQNLRKYFCAPQRLTLYIGDYTCQDFCCFQARCRGACSLLAMLAEERDAQKYLHYFIEIATRQQLPSYANHLAFVRRLVKANLFSVKRFFLWILNKNSQVFTHVRNFYSELILGLPNEKETPNTRLLIKNVLGWQNSSYSFGSSGVASLTHNGIATGSSVSLTERAEASSWDIQALVQNFNLISEEDRCSALLNLSYKSVLCEGVQKQINQQEVFQKLILEHTLRTGKQEYDAVFEILPRLILIYHGSMYHRNQVIQLLETGRLRTSSLLWYKFSEFLQSRSGKSGLPSVAATLLSALEWFAMDPKQRARSILLCEILSQLQLDDNERFSTLRCLFHPLLYEARGGAIWKNMSLTQLSRLWPMQVSQLIFELPVRTKDSFQVTPLDTFASDDEHVSYCHVSALDIRLLLDGFCSLAPGEYKPSTKRSISTNGSKDSANRRSSNLVTPRVNAPNAIFTQQSSLWSSLCSFALLHDELSSLPATVDCKLTNEIDIYASFILFQLAVRNLNSEIAQLSGDEKAHPLKTQCIQPVPTLYSLLRVLCKIRQFSTIGYNSHRPPLLDYRRDRTDAESSCGFGINSSHYGDTPVGVEGRGCFTLRRRNWEKIADSGVTIQENDACIDLRLFGCYNSGCTVVKTISR